MNDFSYSLILPSTNFAVVKPKNIQTRYVVFSRRQSRFAKFMDKKFKPKYL